jgi:hypothetical protein
MRPLYPQCQNTPTPLMLGWVEGATATEPETQYQAS